MMTTFLLLLFSGLSWGIPLEDSPETGFLPELREIPGGMVVLVGVEDLSPLLQPAREGKVLIHGLYETSEGLEKASGFVRKNGLEGKFTLSLLDGGSLPFVGNMVNLLVVRETEQVSVREMLRIVAPRGRIRLFRKEKWETIVKRENPSTDEWPQSLYNASNHGVSKDREAGPPRHMQWTAGPLWCRSHEASNSFRAMVSAGGRVFYIMDEGSRVFLSSPAKWMLSARDAHNGKLLWKKELSQGLTSHLMELKKGITSLAHRLLATDKVVCLTDGFNGPVTCLDARTGKELWRCAGSENTEEILLYEGVIHCTVRLSKDPVLDHPYRSIEDWRESLKAARVPRKIVAVDLRSGEILWEHRPDKTVLPLGLAVGEHGLFYHDGESIVALDHEAGKRWRSDPVDYWKEMTAYGGANLVLYQDVVLFSSSRDYRHQKNFGKGEHNIITSLDAKTGRILWTAPHLQKGAYFVPSDLMVANGLVWDAQIDAPHDSGRCIGRDPRTGEIVRDIPGDNSPQMPHHRCYRNRSTERFYFTGRTGVNVLDLKTGEWTHDYWLRGSCKYGMMPANGMLYVPPNSCACYASAKLRGFNVLAPAKAERKIPASIPEGGRLFTAAPEKAEEKPAGSRKEDWPTFRGDAARHGMAKTGLSEAYEAGWEASIGGGLTQPVVSGGLVLVSAKERHTVHALKEKDGEEVWRFRAGGMVDSPPTIWNDTAFFGCRDGWIYALHLRSGALKWKYRAAPADRRILADDHLESVWPLSGAVLVVPDPETGRGRVYGVAGRSMFLDGGLRLLVLDAESGRKLHETVMNEVDPETGKSIQQGRVWPPNLPAALPDILSWNGRHIYMGIQPFTLQGATTGIHASDRKEYVPENRKSPAGPGKRKREHDHLFATVGFLDDSEWHRSLWLFGSDSFGGCWNWPVPTNVNPAGNILCVDGKKVYGFGREFYTEGRKSTMHLFSTDRNPDVEPVREGDGRKVELRGPEIRGGTATLPRYDWSFRPDIHVRALITGKNREAGSSSLLAAVGVPRVISEYDAHELFFQEQKAGLRLEKLVEKAKALEGEQGGVLMILSSRNGEILSRTGLKHPAVFDGMAAANGRIFVSDIRGNVQCLHPKE